MSLEKRKAFAKKFAKAFLFGLHGAAVSSELWLGSLAFEWSKC
jgi:hypothetical protein